MQLAGNEVACASPTSFYSRKRTLLKPTSNVQVAKTIYSANCFEVDMFLNGC